MARYEWPSEFTKSPDQLALREEHALGEGGQTFSSDATMGNLDQLDDVIAQNFDEDRLWMPIGPHILTNGQATRNPIVSGRVRDVKVSPDGRRAYAGTANGGVWYWTESHGAWRPLGSAGLAPTTDRSDLSLTVGALLVEFGATEAGDIVYVGTGELRPRFNRTPGGSFGGLGVLRLNTTLPAALAAPQSNPWVREAENLSGAGIYRLARNPSATFNLAGEGTLVAATSRGLFTRNGAFSEDEDWTAVEFLPNPFTVYGSSAHCTDVVWNDQGLWVTFVGSTRSSGAADGLYRSTNGVEGPFARITLPEYEPGARISLGEASHNTNRMYVLGKRPSPVLPGKYSGRAQLWLVDLVHNATTARRVLNTPFGLFASKVELSRGRNVIKKRDQSHYDQAIAVRMDGSDEKVTIGGSLEITGSAVNASIFDLTISINSAGRVRTNFQSANQRHAHRDSTYIGWRIHADVHSLSWIGDDMWVGCDGGVFRRVGGNPHAQSLNVGLTTLEVGYIDMHPTNDGTTIAGTQDNGAIQRIGDTVWRLERKGDGGGCLFHPTQPQYRVMQYVKAYWRLVPNGFRPSGPVFRGNDERSFEKAEDKRSSFYSQAAVARSDNDVDARLFIGTDRIWLSRDWDRGRMHWVTIPTNAPGYGRATVTQDQLTEGGKPDPVIAIDIQNESRLASMDGMVILVLCKRTVRLFRNSGGVWTGLAASTVNTPSAVPAPSEGDPFVRELPSSGLAIWTDIAPHRMVGDRAQFYVTTTGNLIPNSAGDLEADPDMDTLWWFDGEGRWFRTGLVSQPLDPSSGEGGSSAPAFSVVVNPENLNEVFVGNRIGVWRGLLDESGTHPSWTWRPAMEGLPHTVVQDLKIKRYDTQVFLQAGLVSRGVWERDISDLPTSVGSTFIRTVRTDTGRLTLPDPPLNPRRLTGRRLRLHRSPDIILLRRGAHPWDPGLPHEAQMMDARMPSTYRKRIYDGFVMIHHRHTTPLPAADANIDLFLQTGAPRRGIDRFAMTDDWRNAVANSVNGVPAVMPAGLSHVGRFNPGAPVDARTPRAVKIPVDLRIPGRNDHVMLVAVVTSPGNGFDANDLDEPNLGDVVRNSAQVAVRMIRRQ